MVSGNRFSAVRITDVKLAIADSPARKRILILDCCYSGRAFHGEMALNSDRIKSAIDVAGTYGIAAVPADRTAFAPPRRRLTEFTQTLVTILERGVPDKASILTIEEIFDSLRAATSRRATTALPEAASWNEGASFKLARNRYYRNRTKIPTNKDMPVVVSHVSLLDRKMLFARHAISEAFADPALGLVGESSKLVYLEKELLHCADNLNSYTSPDSAPLDAEMHQLSILASKRAQQLDMPLDRSVVGTLHRLLNEVNCTECAHEGALVCNGGQRDQENVSGEGLCIRPIRSIFANANRLAIQYYTRYVRGFLINKYHAVRFELGTKAPMQYYRERDSYSVGTKYGRWRLGRTVVADIDVRRYDHLLSRSLFYEFFCECFCNVYRGGNEPLLWRNPFCAWMERLAMKSLEEIPRNSIPEEIIGCLPTPFDYYLDQARVIHSRRYEESSGFDESARAELRSGRGAADAALVILESLCDRRAAWEVLMRFSCSLNHLGLDREQVLDIIKIFIDIRNFGTLEDKNWIFSEMTNFISKNDKNAFLQAVGLFLSRSKTV